MILLVIQIKLLKMTFVQKLSCPKAIYMWQIILKGAKVTDFLQFFENLNFHKFG